MKILTISGSSRPSSSNAKLLEALALEFPQHNIYKYNHIVELPLFRAEADTNPLPESVKAWRKALRESDAVIISTPEYIYNLPAIIKNALEWIASSGELVGLPVLAITFTPHAPRGEKTMQSLLWSLTALDARIVGQLALYQNEVEFDEIGKIKASDSLEMLKEGVSLLL